MRGISSHCLSACSVAASGGSSGGTPMRFLTAVSLMRIFSSITLGIVVSTQGAFPPSIRLCLCGADARSGKGVRRALLFPAPADCLSGRGTSALYAAGMASVLSRSSHRFRYAGIPSNNRIGTLR